VEEIRSTTEAAGAKETKVVIESTFPMLTFTATGYKSSEEQADLEQELEEEEDD
jgi:hypothetical protein